MERGPGGCNAVLLKARETGLYEKLVAQLQKDFALANIQWVISGTSTNAELCSAVKEKIYRLMMEDFNAYLNVMYVVDIPESSFKKIAATDVVAVAGEVAFMVLSRELQKVTLKQAYGT